jgi:hypothetical protein
MQKFNLHSSAVLAAILLLAAVIIIGCQNNPDTRVFSKAKTFDVIWRTDTYGPSDEQFTIVEVDSCEYLIGQYDRSRFVTHKGNCKFCAARHSR